ncbi:hypothetical protein [Methylosinus sp. Sm6]|uniref:DUF6928 family protein n=1 Tax=Methylosinus sp. Sm6 TaxID=2866948 RepID=UPI001C9A1967|nr:hypothetical protein [Methylosinus sp. Sm6]MBY6240626.1 hypothetical protein [Methylosinus sp. Sm6]
MGTKCDMLLIRPARVEESEALLRDLGFQITAPLGEECFCRAIWPKRNTIWVGRAGDCLILSSKGLANQFFEKKRSDFMSLLFARFPESEIAALMLHSVVNLWGFALYRNGEPFRRKAGAADDGTYLDEGAPIAEEEELLAKSTLDAEGRRVYRLPQWPDEEFPEDGVGEEFVLAIFDRMTAARPEAANLDISCVGFALRPWWKFW